MTTRKPPCGKKSVCPYAAQGEWQRVFDTLRELVNYIYAEYGSSWLTHISTKSVEQRRTALPPNRATRYNIRWSGWRSGYHYSQCSPGCDYNLGEHHIQGKAVRGWWKLLIWSTGIHPWGKHTTSPAKPLGFYQTGFRWPTWRHCRLPWLLPKICVQPGKCDFKSREMGRVTGLYASLIGRTIRV